MINLVMTLVVGVAMWAILRASAHVVAQYITDNVEETDFSLEEDGGDVATSMKLTNWVCSTGVDCAMPEPGSVLLENLAGFSISDGIFQSNSGGSNWKKAATLSNGADVDWLIIVTNTGDTELFDIQPLESSTTGIFSTTTDREVVYGDVDTLQPGMSVVFTSTTYGITDTNALGIGTAGEIDVYFGEAPYIPGKAVIRTSKAIADTAEEVLGPPDRRRAPIDGSSIQARAYPFINPIESNLTSAEVRVNPIGVPDTGLPCSTN